MKPEWHQNILVVLAALLVLAFPGNGWAQFTYTTNNGAITITGYGGPHGHVTIPGTINGYPVAAIGANAFSNLNIMTGVTIPNSVTSIGDWAFYDCSLGGVTIPNSVTNIGDGAFAYCYGLTSIAVNAGNPSYASASGVLFNKTLTALAQYPAGLDGSFGDYPIPGSVTSIGNYAFSGCSGLTSVEIGNSVTNIGNGAFQDCSGLMTVTVPDSVISIGKDAFYQCSGLTSVMLGNSVTNIGEQAFYACYGLRSVTIPSSVTSIGKDAFGYSGLTNIAVNAGNPSYASSGGVLFNKTMTTLIQCPASLAGSFSIPTSVTNIGEDAFYFCSHLTNVTFGNSVTSIGDWAFFVCSGLTSMTFPDSLTTIGNYAFYQSGLRSVTLGNGVTNIGTEAFYGSGLSSVTIPSSVSNIGSYAFAYCGGLTNIAVNPGNPSYSSSGGVLFSKTMTTLILCPQGLADLTGSYTIPDSVTNVGDGAFIGTSGLTPGLTNVTIGNNVIRIGNSAFWGCYGLTSITIPNSVTSIGNFAFTHCPGLTNVTLGSSVTTIGNDAFDGCSGLTSVLLPNSVTTIGDGAFLGCSGLTSLMIPESVTSIGSTAFSSCPGLTNITVNAGNPSYASAGGVLFNKTMTTLIQCPQGLAGSFAIPDSVTSIGNYAFLYCSGLTSVTLGNSVADIGTKAFHQCSGLTSLTMPNSVTSIGDSAFSYCERLHQAYFQGNAPRVNGADGNANNTVFLGETGTAYYLPGTTGWGATFGGWPSVAGSYQPQPQILGPGFGLGAQSNGFQFTIFWATNAAVVVEASTNLLDWTPVITNALVNGAKAFTDPTWATYPRRFYRVRSL